MSRLNIKQGNIKGEISIPSSKSHTLRAILFGALAKGTTQIENYLDSTDSQAMIEACRCFGATIDVNPMRIKIQGLDGLIKCCENVIDSGNSGIVLRFCTAVSALCPQSSVITGDYSIRHLRSVKSLIIGLSQLHVDIRTMRGDDYAPVILKGPIRSGLAEIDGEDSQPVSALLIAGAFAEGSIKLRVRNPGETPWIDLTLSWFDRLGISYKNEKYDNYEMKGTSKIEGFKYRVSGDFSSAAFPIAAALITKSEIILLNMDMNDVQGDKEIIEIFQRMGAHIDWDEKHKKLYVKKSGTLRGITVDINRFIDAIAILAVVGCFSEGTTILTNAAIARHKESNRIKSISTELKKMGADIEETEDGLIIRKSNLKGTLLCSHQDHRIAMALSVAGFAADGVTTIESSECINKTFPTFARDMQQLGAQLEETL